MKIAIRASTGALMRAIVASQSSEKLFSVDFVIANAEVKKDQIAVYCKKLYLLACKK